MNNKKNFAKSKLMNRVKFVVADNTVELEKKINRFYEESCGNFVGQPIMTPFPPSLDGAKTVLMVGLSYTIRVPDVDEANAETEEKK